MRAGGADSAKSPPESPFVSYSGCANYRPGGQ